MGKKLYIFPFRYMNISDEWETPEKQPFKDFVSNYPSFVIFCVLFLVQNIALVNVILSVCLGKFAPLD